MDRLKDIGILDNPCGSDVLELYRIVRKVYKEFDEAEKRVNVIKYRLSQRFEGAEFTIAETSQSLLIRATVPFTTITFHYEREKLC